MQTDQRGRKTNRNVTIKGLVYEMYSNGNDISGDVSGITPSELKGMYMFTSQKQQLSVTNLNLSIFLE